MTDSGLLVGFAERDITPPLGLLMCGALAPRKNVGTSDPLMAKALVAQSGANKVAVVGVDLIGLPRETADRIIEEAASRAGIDRAAIMISCSHTHSGPYTMDGLYAMDVTDAEYLSSLPTLIASSIGEADTARQPATIHIGRALVHHGLHHRRVLCNDGKAFNTWMVDALNDIDTCPQVIGSCGPIDPELWVLRFDDAEGHPFGVLFNFSLHVNSFFGETWSADYPGVVAEHMRDAFGRHVITVFTPGACANINPTLTGEDQWRKGAGYLAEQAVAAAKRAKQVQGPIVVGAARRDVTVPRRDPQSQPEGAIQRLDWGGGRDWAEVFEPMVEYVANMPQKLVLPVNAAHIGPFAVASNPGELFVEYGLSVKQRSPFPHTVVAELTNDCILYQPTREALGQQGYETLVGPNRVSSEGIEKLVDTAVELLQELWIRGGEQRLPSAP